jgi:glycine/D-amino acid oxidase-like deaminating enzyme
MTTVRPLPSDARIAIMGAGCAGLTCAEELRERGHRRVTLFEAQRRAGGKVRSVPYADAPPSGRGLFEAGTVFFLPSPMWTKLLRRHGVAETQTFMPRVRIADVARGTTINLLRFAHGHSIISRARQVARLAALLQRHGREYDRRPGVAAHVTPDLCRDTQSWFESAGLPYVRDVVLPIAGGAQFGPMASSVPVVYVMRLLALLRRYSLVQQVSRQMPQLQAGHEALWTKVAATHDVRYGQPVTRITANSQVTVATADGCEQFDALIVAAPTAAYLNAATHLDAQQRDLLQQVRTLSREVITARVAGLPAGAFYAPRYRDDGSVPPAHPYLFYEVDRGSGVFTFHPYLDGGRDSADAEAAIRAVVGRFGGRVVAIEHRVTVQGWFPHFAEAALRAGAYTHLEAMQGRNNVWMAGELLAGIGVPHGMEYAAALVQRMVGLPAHG